ncbi:GntR family transcriptional regulator [Reyranella sp.]|uniref:GntR family transcriptional regulator n=1 Tax=Reyranella sp. TaxID=1929291 RepID=UPI0040356210
MTGSRPRASRAAAARARKGDVETDLAVYEAIRRALLMGRLLPGTKLAEPALARVLRVSRERVRKALHRLAHEGWLETVPNRGTFVPALTIQEVREIYEVRTMLETGIVQRLCRGHDNGVAQRLRAHVAEERTALRNDDRGRLFGLSGDFHLLLAELLGNDQLTRLMRGLLTRSTMHFSLAAPERFHNCAGPHDHADIVKAVLARDARKAAKLMLDHLVGLAEWQSSWRPPPIPIALEDAFRGIDASGPVRD